MPMVIGFSVAAVVFTAISSIVLLVLHLNLIVQILRLLQNQGLRNLLLN